MTDTQNIAAEAAVVVDEIAKYEPLVAGIVGAIPQAAIPVAMIQPWVPGILNLAVQGLNAIATKNGGDFGAAVIEWMQHNTQGQPNSPILSPGALNMPMERSASEHGAG